MSAPPALATPLIVATAAEATASTIAIGAVPTRLVPDATETRFLTSPETRAETDATVSATAVTRLKDPT